jgi:hypothetical protein
MRAPKGKYTELSERRIAEIAAGTAKTIHTPWPEREDVKPHLVQAILDRKPFTYVGEKRINLTYYEDRIHFAVNDGFVPRGWLLYKYATLADLL